MSTWTHRRAIGRRVVMTAALALVASSGGAGPSGTGPPAAKGLEAEIARASALYDRTEFAQAERLLTRLRAREGLSPAQRAMVLLRLAAAQLELGRFEEARRAAEEAEGPARAAGGEWPIRLEIVRGSEWRFRGFARRGLPHYERALELARQAGRNDLASQALAKLASSYAETGDWSRSLDYTERAFEAQADPSDAQRFSYLVHRGIALFEFNDLERARRAFRDALDIAQRTGNRRGESFALGELGLVAWAFEGDAAAALALFEGALTAARAIGNLPLEVTWLNNSAGVLRDSSRLEEALSRYRQALALEERTGQRRERPTLLKNIGQVLALQGQPGQAEPILLEALAEAGRKDNVKIGWQARMELAGVYHALADPARAERMFTETLDVLEASQATVLLEGFRAGMLGRALARYDPYDRFIQFLLARGEDARAFTVAERARARVFLENLLMARDELARAVPAEYLRSETELLQRISTGQARLRTPGVPAAERRAVAAAVEAAEEALTTRRLRLALDRPALAQARFPRVWSVEEARRELLGADEALVMFFLGRSASAAWIVDHARTEVVRLPARAEIEDAVRRLLPTLQSPRAAVHEEARAWLSRAVAAPVVAQVPEGAHIVVVPHAILGYLPFEVLADERGRYLVERNTLSYAPSVSSLAYLRQASRTLPAVASVLAVGSPVTAASLPAAEERALAAEWAGRLKPLPHSRRELRGIADTFEPASRLLEGPAATEEAVQEASRATGLRILHFATHALIDEAQPERSGLALSPLGGGSDGILQTREIYGLKLEGALVTLSACQTALGREVSGEGLMGMSRAFFYSGAAAVTASLWNVGDRSTSDLMEGFYRQIRGGASPDRALAEAKRTFLRGRGERRHPYYWAPFIVTGHARQAVHFPVPAAWGGPAAALALCAAGGAAAGLVIWGRRRWRRRVAGSA
jgi:CHAT domain-containing protein